MKALLWPWNTFIDADSFFQQRCAGRPYAKYYTNIFSFSFQGVQLLTLTASVLLDAGAARRRLALPMRAQVVLFAAMSALVFLPLPPDAFFAATVW